MHLLYSANRWERVGLMRERLADGVTIVLDRYAFSGVAFSSAKDGMDLAWCMQPDAGLPAPNLLLHLELGANEVWLASAPLRRQYDNGGTCAFQCSRGRVWCA